MHNLVETKKPIVHIYKNNLIADSLDVATFFEMRHSDVLSNIYTVLKDLSILSNSTEPTRWLSEPQFVLDEYTDSTGRKLPKYKLDELAFSVLSMRFKGKKAFQFQLAYAQEFKRMREALQRQQNESWKEARLNGKFARKELTDTIQRFVQYATDQGSRNAKHYYSNITKMTYKCLAMLEKGAKVGKNFRDMLDFANVTVLTLAEMTAEKAIQQGMDEGLPYKQIYELAKNRVEVFAAANLHLLEGRPKPQLKAG